MINKIMEMLRLQQILNDETNGEGWESGVNKHGKSIDWYRAMWLEAAESVESFNWKHWKDINTAPDYENVKIETVDIWHFVSSQLIVDSKIETSPEEDPIEAAFAYISGLEGFQRFSEMSPSAERASPEEQMKRIEAFAFAALLKGGEGYVNEFFLMCVDTGMDLDSLYSLYLGKNILNSFRQHNGYREEGKYFKIWGKVEDNVIMQGIIAKNPDINAQELYASLELNYQHLCLDIATQE